LLKGEAMVLARTLVALTLVTATGSVAHAAPSPQSVAQRVPTTPGDVVAVRLTVAYPDVHALAGVLKDILGVRPDRGDVRAILPDGRDASLLVFATPEGHAAVRRVLTHVLAATAS
jgi:hypothetical protein